jgi:hypothetical protein
VSDWRVSLRRVPYRRHLHFIGVYLTGVHLMGVYLITLFRGYTASGDIAGSCLQGCGLSGSTALPASVIECPIASLETCHSNHGKSLSLEEILLLAMLPPI